VLMHPLVWVRNTTGAKDLDSSKRKPFFLLVWSVLQLSLVCREWGAMVTTDRFIRSHAAAHTTSCPRVMLVSDPFVGSFYELEAYIRNPHRYGIYTNRDNMFQCSQPCHGLNLGS
jgi:hypothetical protein